MVIALVLLSGFLHALWNALLRLERDKDRALVAAIAVATLFAAIVAAARWALGGAPFASWAGLGWTIAAGLFEAAYFATLARAMERGRLGVVYTISRGGAVVVVWPLSIALLAEHVTAAGMTGSAIVVAGLAITGLGAGGPGATGALRAAIAWSSACAVAIAAYHLAYKAALAEAVNPSACFAVSLGVSAAINVVRQGRSGQAALRAVIRARWPRIIVMGVVCSGSFLILMEALALGGSGYVLTLRNTAVLFATGLAWWIGERPRRTDVAGALLVAGGAIAMAL